MRVIKKGLKPPQTFETRCSHCKAVLEVDVKKDCKLVSDQRDGDFYQFRCCECGNKDSIDAKLLRARR